MKVDPRVYERDPSQDDLDRQILAAQQRSPRSYVFFLAFNIPFAALGVYTDWRSSTVQGLCGTIGFLFLILSILTSIRGKLRMSFFFGFFGVAWTAIFHYAFYGCRVESSLPIWISALMYSVLVFMYDQVIGSVFIVTACLWMILQSSGTQLVCKWVPDLLADASDQLDGNPSDSSSIGIRKKSLFIAMNTALGILVIYTAHVLTKADKPKWAAITSKVKKKTRAAEEKWETVSAISHDLRNPLHGVMSSVQMLEFASTGERMELIANIKSEGDVLHQRFSSILRMGSKKGGLEEEEKCVFSMRKFMASFTASKAFARKYPNNAVVLRDAKVRDVRVLGHKHVLEQIVENLVGNALRESPDGLPVAISGDVFRKCMAPGEYSERFTRFDGGRAVLERSSSDENEWWLCVNVRDWGGGISPDVLPRLFQPYVTGHAGQGGTGLGLHLCRSMAVRMGGYVDFDAEGRGTTFWIMVPIEVRTKSSHQKDCIAMSKSYDVVVDISSSTSSSINDDEDESDVEIEEEEDDDDDDAHLPVSISIRTFSSNGDESSLSSSWEPLSSSCLGALELPCGVEDGQEESFTEAFTSTSVSSSSLSSSIMSLMEDSGGQVVGKYASVEINKVGGDESCQMDGSTSDAGVGVNILVVEDNRLNRMVVKKLIGVISILDEEEVECKMNLSFAETGEEALESLERVDPHVILMDQSLPGLSGDETCKRVRERMEALGRGSIQPCVVCCSALDEERIQRIMSEASMEYSLQKPFTREQLKGVLGDAVREALRRRASLSMDGSFVEEVEEKEEETDDEEKEEEETDEEETDEEETDEKTDEEESSSSTSSPCSSRRLVHASPKGSAIFLESVEFFNDDELFQVVSRFVNT